MFNFWRKRLTVFHRVCTILQSHQHGPQLLSFFKIYLFILPFVLLGPHPQHMEVPRQGVESELQLPAYTTATATPDPSASATYTTAHGNAGSFTH